MPAVTVPTALCNRPTLATGKPCRRPAGCQLTHRDTPGRAVAGDVPAFIDPYSDGPTLDAEQVEVGLWGAWQGNGPVAFARALHERTGWPMVGIEVCSRDQDDPELPSHTMIEKVAVELPNGKLITPSGLTSVEQLAADRVESNEADGYEVLDCDEVAVDVALIDAGHLDTAAGPGSDPDEGRVTHAAWVAEHGYRQGHLGPVV